MYCKQVVVQTDHKTLESIRKKSIASLRLQPLLIRLSIYDEVRYIPEKANVFADSLSRESYIEKPAFNNRVSLIEVNTITGKLEGMGECIMVGQNIVVTICLISRNTRLSDKIRVSKNEGTSNCHSRQIAFTD